MKVISKIVIIFMLFMFLSGIQNSYAIEVTLNKISEEFNRSDTVEMLKQYSNKELKSEVDGNRIVVSGYNEGQVWEAILENNIIKMTSIDDDDILAAEIIDSVGKVYGYEEGDWEYTYKSGLSQEYTLENGGFERKKISETEEETSIDISKEIKYIPINEIYLTPKEFEPGIEWLKIAGGFYQFNFANHIFRKENVEGETIKVYIANEEELNISSYKSLLSAFEVMFESKKAAKYFEENYSSFDLGNKSIEGIEIEINPELSKFEEYMFGELPLAKLTIKRDVIKEKMNSISDDEIQNYKQYDEWKEKEDDFEIKKENDDKLENKIEIEIEEENNNKLENETNKSEDEISSTLFIVGILIVLIIFIIVVCAFFIK